MKTLRSFIDTHFPFIFATPALLWQFYFLYVPLGVILSYSVLTFSDSSFWPSITFDHYYAIANILYVKIFFNSVLLATTTATICLIIGYPVAYYLAVKAKRFKMALLIFLILPSWTSFIVQIYAWFFVLKKHAFLSNFLYFLGVTNEPIHLLNTYGATLIGMVYCYLPFMVLPLYAVLERMDKRLLEVSADLGANRFQTFRRIVFPLSLQGVAAGLLLVFVPAFGEFAIPDLLGGIKNVYMGNVIVEKFLIYRDWSSGAATVSLGYLMPLLFVWAVFIIVNRLRKKLHKIRSIRKGVVRHG